jgi:hypothetical protein
VVSRGKDRGVSRNLRINPAYANPWLDSFRLAKKEVAASSGAYSYGMARVVKDLPGMPSIPLPEFRS